MDFVKSQNIKETLTHVLHKEEDFEKISKIGIKITLHKHNMIWKPEAFWISMDYAWERWCTRESFGDMRESTICDVSLKDNLKFLKITNPREAEELGKLLLPKRFDVPELHMFRERIRYSDMFTLMIYQTEKIKQGILIGSEFWDPITKNYDGIYFRNSGSLHFETFFNTWDANCIALFDGKNATIYNPRLGKEIFDSFKE